MEAGHRLVIGVGGTGKSTLLREWTNEASNRLTRWATGSGRRFVSPAKIIQTLDDEPDVVVLDELQWFAPEALETVADLLDRPDSPEIWGSRRPWPTTDTLTHISSVLSETNAPTTTGFLAQDVFRPAVAKILASPLQAEMGEWLFEQSQGSVGIAADIIASDWHLDPSTPMPDRLSFLLTQRLEKCGGPAEKLAQILVLNPNGTLTNALAALPKTGLQAEEDLRASGLTTAEQGLLQVVETAVRATLSTKTRATIFDSLATRENDPLTAATFALNGSLQDPVLADVLDRAAAQTWWSRPQQSLEFIRASTDLAQSNDERDTLDHASAFRLGVEGPTTPKPPAIEFAQAVRDMRWDHAAEQANPGCKALVDLARTAKVTDPATSSTEPFASATLAALQLAVGGDTVESIARFAAAANDYDRTTTADFTSQFLAAYSPHRVGTLTALALGDLPAAEVFTRQALASSSIAPAEHRTFELFGSYFNLLSGDFKEALEVTTQPNHAPSTQWCFRDQLLWSSLNAGLARRSGDISRLRDAWTTAEALILQISPSWLYLEPLHDLLVAGARLGELERIDPVVDELQRQASRIGGETSINAAWLSLNIALAQNSPEAVAESADALAGLRPVSRRNIARQIAGNLWRKISGPDTEVLAEKTVIDCADQVAEVADPWQASRLLGQSALDQNDPKVAKRLLEKARDVVTEIGQTATNTFGEWGLSDREAEVARLVAEGHAYKQIGERLYISPKTVEHHVAKIRQKLGASSRAEMLKKINSSLG